MCVWIYLTFVIFMFTQALHLKVKRTQRRCEISIQFPLGLKRKHPHAFDVVGSHLERHCTLKIK